MKKILLTTALVLAATPAFAEHIKSPKIEAGIADIHNTMAFENASPNAFENELEFSYGFSDKVKGYLSVISHDEQGESFDYFAGAELSVQFKVADEGEYRPATALMLGYEWTDTQGDADEVILTGLFEKNIGKFNNIINLKVGKTVGGGRDGGLEAGLNARSVYEVAGHTAVGLEYFGKFGEIGGGYGWNEQGHQLGPVVMFEPIENIHASVAALFGVSDSAADSALKFEVGYYF